MKVVIVITEGVHDPAYLRWILKSLELKEFKGKLSELPEPFSSNMKNRLKEEYNFAESDERNFQELSRPYTLPRLIMINEDKSVLFFIYISRGESRNDLIKNIIKLNVPKPNEDNELEPTIADLEYGFAFFVDADKDYGKTELKLKSSIKDYFSLEEHTTSTMEAVSVLLLSDNIISYYIFPDKETNGAMEDIVLPMMQIKNEKFFENINLFVEENFTSKQKKDIDIPFEIKKKKAKIGVAGQLFKETVGSANYSIIMNKELGLITQDKIEQNDPSKKIKIMFEEILKKIEEVSKSKKNIE